MHPAQVWREPDEPAYDQPRLTDELLDAAESQLGVRLPEALVALLRVKNGGVLQLRFPLERNYNTVHYSIRGVGPNWPRVEKEAWWHDPEWGPPRPVDAEWLIPFDGDGHWDLCLDYRSSPTDSSGLRLHPAVVVVDTEELEPNIESFVAESFDDYLAQLVPPDDE
ncbi:SMI1/KNR4 family protein [Mycobacterium sp. NPDC050441]|uniref:SMI1/KNR4 family protein n=1 Tax=Mycobacterium sp. NPDC050441 TaxID=3155403 RepID=UPI0033F68056